MQVHVTCSPTQGSHGLLPCTLALWVLACALALAWVYGKHLATQNNGRPFVKKAHQIQLLLANWPISLTSSVTLGNLHHGNKKGIHLYTHVHVCGGVLSHTFDLSGSGSLVWTISSMNLLTMRWSTWRWVSTMVGIYWDPPATQLRWPQH